jgi:hypothetical protein
MRITKHLWLDIWIDLSFGSGKIAFPFSIEWEHDRAYQTVSVRVHILFVVMQFYYDFEP